MSARVAAVAVGLPGIVFRIFFFGLFSIVDLRRRERNDGLPENRVKSEREGPA